MGIHLASLFKKQAYFKCDCYVGLLSLIALRTRKACKIARYDLPKNTTHKDDGGAKCKRSACLDSFPYLLILTACSTMNTKPPNPKP